MSWPLREISGFDELDRIIDADGRAASIGCYFKQRIQDGGVTTDHMLVILPPGGYEGQWIAGGHPSREPRWQMTGEWPSVSFTPSIRFCTDGGYHGYITNGVITDDCDGRKF